jgi:hypothetical protein
MECRVVSAVVAIGSLLVVMGIAWRAVSLQRDRARVADALASSDAATRAAALRRIGRTGLTPYAQPLLELTSRLSDPVRGGELAWLVASMQWEPLRDPRVAQLRLWADNYYRESQLSPPPRLASAPVVPAPTVPEGPQVYVPAPIGARDLEPHCAPSEGTRTPHEWRVPTSAAPVPIRAPAAEAPTPVAKAVQLPADKTSPPGPRDALTAVLPIPGAPAAALLRVPPVVIGPPCEAQLPLIEDAEPPWFVEEVERILGRRVLRIAFEPAIVGGPA